MNSEALRKHLAIKARGWELIGDIYWGDGVAQSYESSWKPDENIDQAMECIETFEWYSICKNDDSYAEPGKPYSCEVGQGVEVGKSKTMAMSLAAAKATGWVE